MKVVVYPADVFGCGHHRLIWPAETLQRQGHNVSIVPLHDRNVRISMDGGHVTDVAVARDVDVIVFQRTTHAWLAEAIGWLTAQGVATVVDVDDDLSSIHPNNPAFKMLHPDHLKERKLASGGQPYLHSWENLVQACNSATLVTVSAPGLLKRYATQTPGCVLPNYLAPHYYGIPRIDSNTIGWGAAYYTHPNDPRVVGAGLTRVMAENNVEFRMLGDPVGAGVEFGLREDPTSETAELLDWPEALSHFGVGIAPLADTLFNSRKSWLKPLEMSAVGVPWVASPRREYTRLHALGAGLLAERPKDWYRELKRLVQDPILRQDLSDAGRAVAQTLQLEDHAIEFWNAWETAYELRTSKRLEHSAS